MRKFLAIIMLLCCCMTAFGKSVIIGGKQVTQSGTFNKSSGVGITFGKIVYDATNNTLTLDNVQMESEKECIYVGSNMTILLKGESYLTTTGNRAGLNVAYYTTTIKSSSVKKNDKLKITSAGSGIQYDGADMTIEDCDIRIYAAYPFFDSMGVNIRSNVTVKNSNVYLHNEGDQTTTMGSIGTLNLVNCNWNNGQKIVGNNLCTSDGKVCKSDASILQEVYPVSVAGINVTARNRNDVLGDGTGSVSMLRNLKDDVVTGYTLWLENANIEDACWPILFDDSSTATQNYLCFKGTNSVTSTANGFSAIYSATPLKIWCEGNMDYSLTIKNTASKGTAISNRGGLILTGGTINIEGPSAVHGISGGNLEIKDANVTLKATADNGSVASGYADADFSTCPLVQPTSGYWDSEKGTFVSNGEELKTVQFAKSEDNVGPQFLMLEQSNLKSSSIRFDFYAEDNLTRPENLTIKYYLKETSAGAWSSAVEVPKGSTSIELTGLRAFMNYYIRFEATDENGNKSIIDDSFKTRTLFTVEGLKVCGNAVTSDNINDILGDGKVYYDNSTKVLTIDNATLETKVIRTGKIPVYVDVINSSIEGLEVKFVGTDTIKASNRAIYLTGANSKITGEQNARVYLQSFKTTQRAYPDVTLGANATISNIEMECRSYITKYTEAETSTLTISGGSVKATNIKGFDALNLEDIKIKVPSNGSYDSTNKYIVDVSGIEATSVEIAPVTDYNIVVKGTKVTNLNAQDVLGDCKVYYDAESNVLTLEGAEIICNDDYCIENYNDDLTISLKGHSALMSKNCAIFSEGHLTIEGCDQTEKYGADSYKLTYDTNSVILNDVYNPYPGFIGEGGLTIKNCSVSTTELFGAGGGILHVDDAGVWATMIDGFQNVTYNKCGVVAPIASWYNTSERCMKDAEGNTPSHIIIRPSSIIYVNGTWITPDNMYDVFGDGGSVMYDYISNTLKLNNATIDCSANAETPVYTLSGVNVELIGENKIKASSAATAFWIYGNGLKFSGNGSLDIIGAGYGIYHIGEGGTEMTDCKLNMNVSDLGICTSGNISLHAASLDINSNSDVYSMLYASGLLMDECELVTPDNYEDIWKSSCNTLSIKPNRTFNISVAGVAVTDWNKDDVLNDGGSVKFDNATNTLTLTDANIFCTSADVLYSTINGLNIWVLEKCKLNGTCSFAGEVTISGVPASKLTIQPNEGDNAINIDGALNIYNIGFEANGKVVNAGSQNLCLKNTEALFVAVDGFGDVITSGTYIESPANIHYNLTRKTYIDNNTKAMAENIKFGRILLIVEGTIVTLANANDIKGDGSVVYDESRNTLCLTNAHLSSNGIHAFSNLFIELKGDNYITGNESEATAISVIDGALGFTGSGSLTISGYLLGVYVLSATELITIHDCNLNISASDTGIYGATNMVLADNANININMTSETGCPMNACSIIMINSHCEEFDYSYLGSHINGGLKGVEKMTIVRETVPGDVDENGTITVNDLALLIKYVKNNCAGMEGITFNVNNADLDSNGTVNKADIQALANKILGK